LFEDSRGEKKGFKRGGPHTKRRTGRPVEVDFWREEKSSRSQKDKERGKREKNPGKGKKESSPLALGEGTYAREAVSIRASGRKVVDGRVRKLATLVEKNGKASRRGPGGGKLRCLLSALARQLDLQNHSLS